MSDINLIIKRLKESIENSDMSYIELEKASGVPKSTIQRYATGSTKKIPIDAIQAIAKAINVSAAYIMGWTDNINEKAPAEAEAKENRIIDMYSRLNPQNQAVFDTLLSSMLEQQDKDN